MLPSPPLLPQQLLLPQLLAQLLVLPLLLKLKQKRTRKSTTKAPRLIKKPRLLLHLPQPHRQHLLLSNLSFDDEDDEDAEFVQDVHVSYRRPSLIQDQDEKEIQDDEPLSDYVTVRLAVARAKAMAKYRELHA
jgi:hypothetical protein